VTVIPFFIPQEHLKESEFSTIEKVFEENEFDTFPAQFIQELACEDSQHLLDSKPNQDEQSFWNYINDYIPNIDLLILKFKLLELRKNCFI
jgi:hypothetical protein